MSEKVVILRSLVKELGLRPAIVIQKIHTLSQEQKKQGQDEWITYNKTYWRKIFPYFLSYTTGYTIKNKLKTKGFLIEKVISTQKQSYKVKVDYSKFESNHQKQYLTDDLPILISEEMAVKIGIKEAIILKKIEEWLQDDTLSIRQENGLDKRKTFNQIRKNFDMLTVDSIYRTLKNLRAKNILKVHSSELNKKKLFYVVDKQIFEMYR